MQFSHDIRALKKERDELKQAVGAFETELEQVLRVCVCVSVWCVCGVCGVCAFMYAVCKCVMCVHVSCVFVRV